MSKTSKIIYFFISILFFIGIDRYFSNLLLNFAEDFQQNSVLDIVFVQNTGAAFSILQNAKVFLICFSALALIGIGGYVIKNVKNISVISLFWASLLVAGIFCNLYERFILGYVRDFFKLNFINFPVFNISDIFINISVFAIVIMIVRNEISNRRINR